MDNPNRNLLQQLFQLEWLLRYSHMQQLRNQGPHGTPYQGQGRILALLRRTSEISQKELAKILDIRSQSLGELLAKLERNGYITRTPSAADRRGMDVRLTEAGRAAADTDEQPLQLESFFACLNEQEQATLSEYLGRLIKSLEQQTDPGVGFGPEFRGRSFGNPFRHDGRQPPADFRGFDRFFDRDQPRPPFGEPETDTPTEDEA
jgi:DNA-binding MarR family transcriptional regulator